MGKIISKTIQKLALQKLHGNIGHEYTVKKTVKIFGEKMT